VQILPRQPNYMNEEVERLAEEIFDYCCANRQDNLNKDGSAGNPRAICCKFNDDPVAGTQGLYENAKNFYRNIARWHLQKVSKP
jgi:hypothetical protein